MKPGAFPLKGSKRQIVCVYASPSPGDLVLNGSSTLTLTVASLQQLTRLFEQYLLSRSQQHGFLALPSHPAETASLLQLQFLFDVLQKTLSLKVNSRKQKKKQI